MDTDVTRFCLSDLTQETECLQNTYFRYFYSVKFAPKSYCEIADALMWNGVKTVYSWTREKNIATEKEVSATGIPRGVGTTPQEE